MKKKDELSLRQGIKEYFASRRIPKRGSDGEILTEKGGGILYEERAPTVTGLALYLGFNSREELLSLTGKRRKALVDRALLKIEEYAEEKLFCKECFQGAKCFLSANFRRWRDGSEEEAAPDLGICSDWAE